MHQIGALLVVLQVHGGLSRYLPVFPRLTVWRINLMLRSLIIVKCCRQESNLLPPG